ncbi:hypothetical protein JD77_00334 [Micromonospora olivasterospora]|uniref:Uncharacterized protein n=1 Tax=Micromonospora olivasterospora TaxID=1880 RepID=A0A562I3V8_MICOL|nr:hypothetical protein [Micromonospora olivasterospora]TWH65398.1 hypothetical protein JD77_00334 [Micromonospora olivasterospora]
MTGWAAKAVDAAIGVVTTRSSDGFSEPPRADQMSASPRSRLGGTAMLIGTVSPRSARPPTNRPGGSTSWVTSPASSTESSRCSSCGWAVHAVTRYDKAKYRGGRCSATTTPSASHSSIRPSRRWAISSRTS